MNVFQHTILNIYKGQHERYVLSVYSSLKTRSREQICLSMHYFDTSMHNSQSLRNRQVIIAVKSISELSISHQLFFSSTVYIYYIVQGFKVRSIDSAQYCTHFLVCKNIQRMTAKRLITC